MSALVDVAGEAREVPQVGRVRRAARRRLVRRLGMGTLGLILVLILWEIAASIIDATAVLPTVQTTVAQFVKYLSQPYPSAGNTIVQDALVSCARILAGFLLGTVAGIAIGSLMAGVRVIRELTMSPSRPVPRRSTVAASHRA